MKVIELIQKLQEMDPEAPVITTDHVYGINEEPEVSLETYFQYVDWSGALTLTASGLRDGTVVRVVVIT